MLEKNFSGEKSVEWRKTCAIVIGEEVSIETYIKYIYLIRRLVVLYRRVFVRVVPYFDEPVGLVKIQTTSRNSLRYYTTKRLIAGSRRARNLVCTPYLDFGGNFVRYRSINSR